MIDQSFYTDDYSHFNENRYWMGAFDERTKGILSVIPSDGKSILDFGAGSGYFSFLLRRQCKNVVSYDYSEDARRFMRTHYKTLDVVDELGDGTFDGILLLDVIEHIGTEQQEAFVRSLLDRLHSGGWIVVSTDSEGSSFLGPLSLLQKIDARLTRGGRTWRAIKRGEYMRPYYVRYQDSHVGSLDYPRLVSLFVNAGCVKEKEHHGFMYRSPLSSIVSRTFGIRPTHSAIMFRKI